MLAVSLSALLHDNKAFSIFINTDKTTLDLIFWWSIWLFFQELWDGDIFLAELEHPCTQVVSEVSYSHANTLSRKAEIYTSEQGKGLNGAHRCTVLYWKWFSCLWGLVVVMNSVPAATIKFTNRAAGWVLLSKRKSFKCCLKSQFLLAEENYNT